MGGALTAVPPPGPITAPGADPRSCTALSEVHAICEASPDSGPVVAQVLAEAFRGYPWTDWVAPSDPGQDRLRALFLLDLQLVAQPYGSVWTARCPSAADVAGAIAVLRPDRPVPPEVWASVDEAQAEVLGSHAPVASAAERVLEDVRPSEPVLVVATLGVLPGHRGRGLARRLLSAALAQADSLGVDAYLETSAERNLMLYRRAGFTAVAHRQVPDGGPSVWAMRRKPGFPSPEGHVRELGS